MDGSAGDDGRADWVRYRLAMILCLGVGLLFCLSIYGMRLGEADLPAGPIEAATVTKGVTGHAGPGGDHASLAQFGGFMAFRGHAALTITVAIALIIVSLLSLRLFVANRRTLRILAAVLLAQALITIGLGVAGGNPSVGTVDRLLCPAGGANGAWHFCSVGGASGPNEFPYWFGFWVALLTAVATLSVVYAIFVAASSEASEPLPILVRTPERAVTVLMVGGSTLLVAVLLLDRALLNWAFADFLARPEVSNAVRTYISGALTFAGALETAMLGVTWLIAVLLLERSSPAPATPDGTASEMRGFSVYNLSAIFAPVLSAVGAGFFAG